MKKIITIAALAILALLVYLGCRSLLYNNYSNEKAVEYLASHAEGHSVNKCAMYVRRAISAGGYPTFGQPPSACDYDLFLLIWDSMRYHKMDMLLKKVTSWYSLQ